MCFFTPRWKYVMSMVCRAGKGRDLSSLDQFLTQFMDQAERTIGPDSFNSVESMLACADRMGEVTAKEIVKWQPRRAVIVQMPKRRSAKK
jgi:hypothetical protein